MLLLIGVLEFEEYDDAISQQMESFFFLRRLMALVQMEKKMKMERERRGSCLLNNLSHVINFR